MASSFIMNMFGGLRRGNALEDWEAEVRRLVDEVRHTRKAGSVTIKLTVGMLSKDDDHALKIVDQVTVAMPKQSPGESIMFATEDGAVTPRDPRQPEGPKMVSADRATG